MAKRIKKQKRVRTPEEKRKSSLRVLIGLFGVLVLVSLYYQFGQMGIAKVKIETDIRKSQQVPEDWTLTGEAGKRVAAYLACPEDVAESGKHIFSLYYVKGGITTGWFFRAGGGLSGVKDGITALQAADKTEEYAYYSLNRQKIAKVVLYEGQKKEETREIDPEKPFALVLPGKAEPVFYDTAGDPVSYAGPSSR